MVINIKSKLLLSPGDFEPSLDDWKVNGVLNPAAVRLKNGKILLYLRIAESSGVDLTDKHVTCPIMSSKEDYEASYEKIPKKDIKKIGRWGEMYLKGGGCRLPTISHFKKAIISKDGFTVEEVFQKPVFTGRPGDGEYGVEDPRIVKIGSDYLMTYVNVSLNEGVSTSLAVSKDLEKWERKGIIFCEQNKDVTLFPEKINGKYYALHRPEGNFEFSKPSIWIAASKDLTFWGEHKAIMKPRKNSWESSRIGGGCPPIKTSKGWLCIYHGVEVKRDEEKNEEYSVYSAGAFLLDLKNPYKVLARTSAKKPLFKPSNEYEKSGFMNNVVFPTGAVESLDGKSLIIFCGAADSSVVVKELKIKDILDSLEKV